MSLALPTPMPVLISAYGAAQPDACVDRVQVLPNPMPVLIVCRCYVTS